MGVAEGAAEVTPAAVGVAMGFDGGDACELFEHVESAAADFEVAVAGGEARQAFVRLEIESDAVVVEGLDNVSEGISHKMSFGKTDIFADEVDNYWDSDFRADYNIIEPTETLDKAVDRLRKANAELKK